MRPNLSKPSEAKSDLGPIDQTGRTPEGAVSNTETVHSPVVAELIGAIKATYPEPSGGSTTDSSSSRPATEDSPGSSAPSRKVGDPKIPHSQDNFILQSHDQGKKKFGDIAVILTTMGIPCKPVDVSNRYYSLQDTKKLDDSSAIIRESKPKEPESLTEAQKKGIRTMRNMAGGTQLRSVAIARRLDVDPKLVDAFIMAEERDQAKADALKSDPRAYAKFLQGCKTGAPAKDPDDEDDRSWEAVEQ